MKFSRSTFLAVLIVLSQASSSTAAGVVEIHPKAQGSVSHEEGLAAWDRVYEVASHPRCSNCHTGDDDRPKWSGPSYGETQDHGMNIRAGESRIGVEYIQCSACHGETTASNDAPHMAPQVGMSWQLAPVEADWFGKTSDEICNQLRDPSRNGERNLLGVAEHLDHDLILHWAWSPGGGREPAPYSLQEHVDDLLSWGAAGAPCPSDDPNAELAENIRAFLDTEGN